MAKLKVSIAVPLAPQDAWEKASALEEFDNWLSIHDGWRCEIPAQLATGTTAESVVSVKGMRNRVKWVITDYQPPRSLALKGDGKGGVRVNLTLSVTPKGDGSEVGLDVELGGAPLFGPIGSGVARALKGDIEGSLKKFVSLYA
ncbi:SRPBCC family protein [Rhodococcus spelaei]|uniref:SRPBCC family protein n=1 Tax=Rhodococcus spelaei TaxID=2546320 RepID=A0A541BP70_9NOCA|nr:SRPBCC family protein [Rhodococcus spelaei]TQF74134.1 SRPBCC family protein [Rhodococcus spelaei]